MMEYHIAICDNEKAQIDTLERIARQWAAERSLTIKIERFPSAEAFLFHYEMKRDYDILLLDIEMGETNGVELARIVRAQDKEAQIIFVTGYMEYISDGYEVEALHYLIKPVTGEKLMEVLDRAAQRLQKSGRTLLMDLGTQNVRVPLYEIRYLEVRRNYVTVHAKEEYTMRATLAELEKSLDDGFFRAGRSYIVNLRHINKVTRTDIVLADGTDIPLPRGLYDDIHRAMIERL